MNNTMQCNTISLFPTYLKIACNKMVFFYKRYGTKETEQTNHKILGKCRQLTAQCYGTILDTFSNQQVYTMRIWCTSTYISIYIYYRVDKCAIMCDVCVCVSACAGVCGYVGECIIYVHKYTVTLKQDQVRCML